MTKVKVAYNTESCASILSYEGEEYPVPEGVKTAHLKNASRFNKVGSKVWIALAMYFRPNGATSNEVEAVCGQAQLNKLRALKNGKQLLVTQKPRKDSISGKDGLTAYFARMPKTPTKRKAKKAAVTE